jgi:hypothetical protein
MVINAIYSYECNKNYSILKIDSNFKSIKSNETQQNGIRLDCLASAFLKRFNENIKNNKKIYHLQ